MDWSIQGIARLTVCTTSRTLRHYDCIGLLAPSRVGGNGHRSYDEDALARLQRILLLRVLGLGLPSIAEVLAGQRDNSDALLTHLHWLLREKERLDRQIAAVETTITNSEGREQLMAEEMFDGFDHTRYKEEVEERWGKNAYGSGDRWWRRMSAEEKAAWYKRSQQLSGDWIAAAESRGRESQPRAAAESRSAPDSGEAPRLAQHQFDWFRGIPGAPGRGSTGPTKDYIAGYGEMYVAAPRVARASAPVWVYFACASGCRCPA